MRVVVSITVTMSLRELAMYARPAAASTAIPSGSLPTSTVWILSPAEGAAPGAARDGTGQMNLAAESRVMTRAERAACPHPRRISRILVTFLARAYDVRQQGVASLRLHQLPAFILDRQPVQLLADEAALRAEEAGLEAAADMPGEGAVDEREQRVAEVEEHHGVVVHIARHH